MTQKRGGLQPGPYVAPPVWMDLPVTSVAFDDVGGPSYTLGGARSPALPTRQGKTAVRREVPLALVRGEITIYFPGAVNSSSLSLLSTNSWNQRSFGTASMPAVSKCAWQATAVPK